MKLGLKERLLARGLLPQQGSMLTLMVVKRAFEVLSLTAEEVEKWHVADAVDADGKAVGTRWDVEANEPMEVALEPATVDVIKKELKALDEKKTLTMDLMSTYEAFMGA